MILNQSLNEHASQEHVVIEHTIQQNTIIKHAFQDMLKILQALCDYPCPKLLHFQHSLCRTVSTLIILLVQPSPP